MFRLGIFGNGGERGIRTPGTLARSTVFETAPFNHSGTSPRHFRQNGSQVARNIDKLHFNRKTRFAFFEQSGSLCGAARSWRPAVPDTWQTGSFPGPDTQDERGGWLLMHRGSGRSTARGAYFRLTPRDGELYCAGSEKFSFFGFSLSIQARRAESFTQPDAKTCQPDGCPEGQAP